MQSWGDSSRFTRRDTRMVPSKSGVLGLLAAADGRRRTDAIEDLTHLRFGVRVDQPGQLQRDFQTAINWDTRESMPLSYRYYVADAVFVAGVEGDPTLLESLADRVMDPRFPLYLGRRSCPVTDPVFLGLVQAPLLEALTNHPWQAARWHRRRELAKVELDLHVDSDVAAGGPVETRRDVPLSFSPERREYGWREVAHTWVTVDNPDAPQVARQASGVDWFGVVARSEEV